MNTLPVLPGAAVCTPHYMRVPVRSAADVETIAARLAMEKLPVRQVVLAAERPGIDAQVLVLTEPVAQGTLDLAARLLKAHPVAAGAVTTLRVEELAG